MKNSRRIATWFHFEVSGASFQALHFQRDFSATNLRLWTLFMNACINGHKNIIKLLLRRKIIDLIGKVTRGWTPYMNACINGHKDVIKSLLIQKKNIDLNGKDKDGLNIGLYIALHKFNFYHSGNSEVNMDFFSLSKSGIAGTNASSSLTSANSRCESFNLSLRKYPPKHQHGLFFIKN